MVEAEDLDRHRYLNLGTYRRSGAEVTTPVWFANVDGLLYVVTAGDSGKAKRLRASSRARVAACDARGRVQGAWQDATARLVSDGQTIRQAHAALRAKYGWQLRLLDLGARLSGRMKRRAWIELSL